MWSMKLILVMVQVLSTANGVTDVPAIFYPFGVGQGDSVLHSNDDQSSYLIPIGINFPFFNRLFSSLYVSIIMPPVDISNTWFWLNATKSVPCNCKPWNW